MPTPTWVEQGPGAVTVPILMYHHIGVSPIGSRYYVTPARFEDQIKLLQAWEYTPITTSMLVNAILEGGSLPPHPVILTFDDANEDNYTTAFPIMQKYGMTGVLYIPYNYIGADGFLSVEQITEMASAGWEVGSHSLSHPNLKDVSPERLRAEIVDSRQKLEDLLGVPILTFAYPFGDINSGIVDYVKFAGYIAAVGATGYTADQGLNILYDLQREEIKGSEDAKTFIRFLPWHGDPAFLPTDTPTATPKPSRTPVPTYTQYPTKTPKPSPTPVP
jgi:peptidoglycan/xylan/chitin deacetylase (PgdA/CDA1 family)